MVAQKMRPNYLVTRRKESFGWNIWYMERTSFVMEYLVASNGEGFVLQPSWFQYGIKK